MRHSKPPAQRPTGQPAATTQVDVRQTEYSGQIPPPYLLRQFDEVIPGTAARIIQWAEDEQSHRHRLEREAQAANIAVQQRELDNIRDHSRAVIRSDLVGQVMGFVVCLSCAGAGAVLGWMGHTAIGIALVAIPTAAVVQAFRVNFFPKK